MNAPAEPVGRAQSRPRLHLVTGVGGQDGILLARHLLSLGDRVVGTVTSLDDPRLEAYLPGVPLEVLDVRDTSAFEALLRRHRPDAVHNLAALSSVGASWDAPDLVDQVNHQAVLGMLAVVGAAGIDFVQASSSEIFGPAGRSGRSSEGETTVTEDTPLDPVSPYAEAKARAHRAVADARTAGARATNLVLFGHTSPVHDATFVLPTITRQAAEVALGRRDAVELRDPSVSRDWGSAADFVRAFARAVRAPYGEYVIATGELNRLGDVAGWALEAAGADRSQVLSSGEPSRRNDFGGVVGDSGRAATNLGWRPTESLRATVEQMVRADVSRLRTGVEHSPAYLV